ncbi:MAG: hypothetical protein J1F39_01320 [Clostridiales bacterium]|nr:hypothetical protein [Clostridiales bacterium]
MRAAIDIGSNSVRLLTTGGIKRSTITKLADGIESTGVLSPVGLERTIAVLTEYAALAGADCEIIAFATEAVRRAKDGEAFISRVKKEVGLDIRLLSPEDEARLALSGAKKDDGAVTVCDLGGGSLEVISAADGVTPEYIKSLPLGVVVLKNKFAGDFSKLTDDAPNLVAPYGKIEKYPVVFMGGSATNIAAGMMNLPYYDPNKVNGYKITLKELDGFLPILLSKNLPTLRPVCAKRADTLAYGAIMIIALLNHIGVTEFTVSDSSNLEAALSGALTPSK